jgi:hypothetical protein
VFSVRWEKKLNIIRERLAVSKQAVQKFDVESFNLRKHQAGG